MSETAPPSPTQIRVQLQQALVHLNRKELVQTEGLLTHILKSQPDEPDTLQLLGALRRVQGRLPEAEALYRRSLAAKPGQPQVHHNLGNLLAALNRNQEALAAQQEAVRLKPNYADAWHNLGSAQQSLGDFAGAERSYRRALQLQPNFMMAMQSLVAVLNDLDRPQEAERIARQALSLNVADKRQVAAIKHNLGVALSRQRHDAEAITQFDEAQALVPDMRIVDYNRGNALQRLGRSDEAVESYRRAVARNPLDMRAHRDLNSLLYRRDDEENFLKSYDEALAIVPDAPVLWLDKAQMLMQAQRYEEAREHYARTAALEPTNITAHDGLAQCAANMGDFDVALAEHKRALATEPENSQGWTSYARTLLLARDTKAALEAAEKGVLHEPRNQMAIAMWGTALRQAGDDREAALNDYENHVQVFELAPPPAYSDMESFNRALNVYLDRLHRDNREYLQQTLRNGTQTVDDLFGAGHEPVEALRVRVEEAVTQYIARMTPDENHPLLSRRRDSFAYSGSWSSRLKDCGFHTNHVHPKGWISSVYYIGLPETVEDENAKEGWLKFGDLPFDAGIGDPIRRHVRPKVGRLVLFPSFMWHGTVPFHSTKTRTTIAFDAVPR